MKEVPVGIHGLTNKKHDGVQESEYPITLLLY